MIALTRKRLIALLIALSAPLAVLLLDAVIVTEEERIHRTVMGIASAVESGDAEALVSHLSPAFAEGNFRREDLRDLAQRFFNTFGRVDLRGLKANQNHSGSDALIAVSVGAIAGTERRYTLVGSSQWLVRLRKEADGEWRVIGLTPRQIGNRPVGSMGELIGYGGL